jgi:hypothetical protein
MSKNVIVLVFEVRSLLIKLWLLKVRSPFFLINV